MTDMIEVKVADLSGEALNWAVATVEGHEIAIMPPEYGNPYRVGIIFEDGRREMRYAPSRDWAVGGPLLDRHCRSFGMVRGSDGAHWRAFAYKAGPLLMRLAGGESILVAACRAIVLLNIGETVSVPTELMP